jgi:hypothetical protein
MTHLRPTADVRGIRGTGAAFAPRGPRRADNAYAEFLQLAPARVNVFVTGPDRVIAPLLDAIAGHLGQPATRWRGGGRLVLPDATDGPLLIRQVGALTRDQQQRVFDWLGARACRIPVVSSSRDSLLPAVEEGTFMAALYYRLNVISLDLT